MTENGGQFEKPAFVMMIRYHFKIKKQKNKKEEKDMGTD